MHDQMRAFVLDFEVDLCNRQQLCVRMPSTPLLFLLRWFSTASSSLSSSLISPFPRKLRRQEKALHIPAERR